MKAYKIEVNIEEMMCIIAALRIYKSEIFDCMLRARDRERWNSLSKRDKQAKQLIEKLEMINDPPF